MIAQKNISEDDIGNNSPDKKINKHDKETGNNNSVITMDLTRKAMIMQVTMSILANLSVLSSGLGLGFPAITLVTLTNSTNSMSLDENQASWFASINMIACPLGALLSSYLLDRFGRKYTLIIINILSMISWGVIAAASSTNLILMYYELLVGRFLIGITTGLSSSPAAVYSAEIANPKLRGRLALLTSFSIASGILLIYTLGYFIPHDWRFIGLICCALSIVSMLHLIPLPESPSWLVMRGRNDDAKRSLQVLRGFSMSNSVHESIINKEIEEMSTQINSRDQNENEPKWKLLGRPEVYKPLAIMITFFGFQQFSGIFVVVVYAAKFAKEAGVQIDPLMCTVFVGLTRVIATILVAYILDSLGRKPPTIFSGFGMAICMFGLAAITFFKITISWLPVFFIVTFIFTSTIGFLTLPFTMIAEMYPLKVRGLASGLTICAAYLMSFIIVKLYPTMLDVMGNEYLFIFYGIVSLFGVIFVWIFLPETKGKTLQEIEEYFKGQSIEVNEVIDRFRYKVDI